MPGDLKIVSPLYKVKDSMKICFIKDVLDPKIPRAHNAANAAHTASTTKDRQLDSWATILASRTCHVKDGRLLRELGKV